MRTSTSMWDEAVNKIADHLSLPLNDKDPFKKGILGLLKASIELAHLSDDPKEYLKDIKPYLDILIPKSDEEFLKDLFEKYPEKIHDPIWLAEYPDDVDKSFPKILFLWRLVYVVPNGSNQPNSLDYIDKIEKYFNVGHDSIASFRGWITKEADSQIAEQIEKHIASFSKRYPICSNFVKILKPKSGMEGLNGNFIDIRDNVQKKLDEVAKCLVPFNLDGSLSLKNLRKYLANDSFRLAVLGEFKRGKSTLVNAIIGMPGLMPAATLPCTSALTEIRYGDNTLYEVNNDGPFGSFKPSDKDEFQSKAGAAAKSRTAKAEAEQEAENVPRWRVHVPSSFLKGSLISILDSPGIGEDYARNRISKAEAERADAAIIVLNIDQLASLQELELIESMKSKASNLIIAVNRADNVSQSEWGAVKTHVLDRIREKTDMISEERIVFISALKAEEAIKHSASDDPWLKHLNDMRSILQNHLIRNAGPIKRKVLKNKVDGFVKECRERIDGDCRLKKKDFTEIQRLQKNIEEAAAAYKRAELSIETGEKILKDSESEENEFIRFFWEKIPEILKKTEENKSSWTSEYSCLSSPKKHVAEVAEKAQRELLVNVENWIMEEGAPFVVNLVTQKYQEAEDKMGALKAYLEKATGVDAISQINEMKKRVFIDIFGDIDFGMTGAIVLRGVIASVIGYVIADIILFYVFELIAGFLNPILLAVAAVIALG